MKFLIAIVLLTSSVYAMKCDFSRPIEVEYLDTEASTNQVFAIGDMDGSRFSPWNLVRIVFRNRSSEDANISYSRFNIPFVIRLR